MTRSRSHLAVLCLLAGALVATAGCAAARPPSLARLRDLPSRTPVVLIPGMTGTQLLDTATGKLVWGDARRIFFPRDRGYSLALPVDPADGFRDTIVPHEAVLQIRLLGVFGGEAYGPVLRLMRANGYTLGDLRDPHPDEDFFFFLNDWRKETADSAAELARQLARLREVRGADVLAVSLICQSNAGLIGRYFVKYGGASLEGAEAGRARAVPGVRVDRLILIGSPNGGSLRMLRELNRGRRYVKWLGRHWSPETLFTFPSMYEGLPGYRQDLFFDSSGKPLALDLFDAANWARYGWSVHAPDVQRRLARARRPDLFADADARGRFLARRLARAQTFHRLLRDDPEGFDPPPYYAIHDGYALTPERALLLERGGRWRTLFDGDRAVRADTYLLSLAASPGDGHMTPESFLWMSPREVRALARPPVIVRGGHFEVILDPATERRMLEFLIDGD